MKKSEYIAKYGLERYEAEKKRNIERQRERYQSDDKFRETKKRRTNTCNIKRYLNNKAANESCRLHKRKKFVANGRIDLIENYEIAKLDDFKDWVIHHRLELTIDGSFAHSAKDLIRLDMYYNRPPYELIWMRRNEHSSMHKTAEHRR